ncbi:2OG-Fe(II) oxygenase, partial [Brazilian cedratvirus IHUMI]
LKAKVSLREILYKHSLYKTYYDVNKCYIGFHGDSERRKVIGLRLGETMPLYFAWWYQGRRISQ